jgi:hypothetical protein
VNSRARSDSDERVRERDYRDFNHELLSWLANYGKHTEKHEGLASSTHEGLARSTGGQQYLDGELDAAELEPDKDE